MSVTTPIPPITPYLFIPGGAAADAVEFYKKAFGALQDGEAHRMPGTDKIMHVRLLINGSLIMIADDFSEQRGREPIAPEARTESPVMLALQLDEVQSFWDRAVAGGAIVTLPLADMFWGDRYGQLDDPFGHRWSVSQTLEALTDQQMQDAADRAMGDKGTLMGEPAGS